MFKKKLCPKVVYDELLDNNEFLRITTNLNGEYVLLHCYGLAENGVTPLRSAEICKTRTLRECKERAQIFLTPAPSPAKKTLDNDYSHVRLPYKD